MIIDKESKLDELLVQFEERRHKYEEVAKRASDVSMELERKLIPALRDSHTLPRVADISLATQSVSSLLKIKLDAEDAIAKSIEKEYTLISKAEDKEVDESAVTSSQVDELLKAMKKKG